jgi:UDP-N-acetylglucosamine 2-epimerase (non-hydrolysing)
MVIVGTRPEVIKTAPVIARLREESQTYRTVVVATAQHRELLDQALDIFQIRPDLDLDLMRTDQDLPTLTGRVVSGMSHILERVRPDIVLVQGDTTTVFAGALAAFYQKIPVAHIEAGLRTYNKFSPFPEEINRRLTTVLSDIHFAPTLTAKIELMRGGVDSDRIVVTGNTVVDALMHVAGQPFSFANGVLGQLDFDANRVLLVTSHRRETWGEGLENICKAVKILVQKYSDLMVVYPVHPNPNVKNTVTKILTGIDRVHLVDPLDYRTFVNLMKRSHVILSDSGGLQEEAPSMKTPLLLLRELTERPEGFEAGLAKVVGADCRKIVQEVENLLEDDLLYQHMIRRPNPYGDGAAAGRIVGALNRWRDGQSPLLSSDEEFSPLKAFEGE